LSTISKVLWKETKSPQVILVHILNFHKHCTLFFHKLTLIGHLMTAWSLKNQFLKPKCQALIYFFIIYSNL
jgi:hypothetical protein